MLSVEIHDTPGDDNPEKPELRKVVYAGANLFILCIASNMRNSLHNIERWKKEIISVVPNPSIALFRTKSDLTGDDEEVKAAELKKIRQS